MDSVVSDTDFPSCVSHMCLSNRSNAVLCTAFSKDAWQQQLLSQSAAPRDVCAHRFTFPSRVPSFKFLPLIYCLTLFL